MNHSKYSLANLRRTFRLTALQLTALVILPLFVFAIVIKVKERKESEYSSDKIISTQNSQQPNYTIQTVSNPTTHDSTPIKSSDSAK